MKQFPHQRWTELEVGAPLAESTSPKGVAFTGTGKLVRGATRYEQKQPKPRYLTLGSPAARAGPSGADWMSVTTVSSDEAAF